MRAVVQEKPSRRRSRHAKRRVVIAFGGHASYPPNIKGLVSEQISLMASACRLLVPLIREGQQLVLTHGNGPVVGNILFRMAMSAKQLPPMPMDVCVAHSQGGMGYMLQQTLTNTLREEGIDTAVASIVTQVEVSEHDPGFANPTKPVGRFFSQDDAQRLSAEHGWQFVEDAGRGHRRVVHLRRLCASSRRRPCRRCCARTSFRSPPGVEAFPSCGIPTARCAACRP